MRNTVADILSFLTDHFHEDFHSYSNTLIEKRITERAAKLHLTGGHDYLQVLKSDPDEPAFLARLLRVRFSSFFRDPLQFELLGSVLIPPMLIHKSDSGLFRAWCAACAGGEEACSIAIIVDEARQLLASKAMVQIFATDVADDALAEARNGTYHPRSLGEVSLQRLDRYFDQRKPYYRIGRQILDMITYSRHDLLNPHTYAPPESLFGGFDLISCRNFLMYLDAEAYRRVFDNLFRALNPEGVLLLGAAESVPDLYAPYLERIFDFGNLYRKVPGPKRG